MLLTTIVESPVGGTAAGAILHRGRHSGRPAVNAFSPTATNRFFFRRALRRRDRRDRRPPGRRQSFASLPFDRPLRILRAGTAVPSSVSASGIRPNCPDPPSTRRPGLSHQPCRARTGRRPAECSHAPGCRVPGIAPSDRRRLERPNAWLSGPSPRWWLPLEAAWITLAYVTVQSLAARAPARCRSSPSVVRRSPAGLGTLVGPASSVAQDADRLVVVAVALVGWLLPLACRRGRVREPMMVIGMPRRPSWPCGAGGTATSPDDDERIADTRLGRPQRSQRSVS
jgi:hypothetical protein